MNVSICNLDSARPNKFIHKYIQYHVCTCTYICFYTVIILFIRDIRRMMLQWSMPVREVRVARGKAMEGDGEPPGMEKGKEGRGPLGRMETMKRSPQKTAREYCGGGGWWGSGRERERGRGSQELCVCFFYICRCGLYECGRKLLNALPDIGEGEEEGTDEYWVSYICTCTCTVGGK
jgi:hypothetical protein